MRIAVPSKGRLQEPALRLLEAVGIKPQYTDPRALVVPTTMNGVELVFIRAEDIPSIVASGAAELGITGHDLVVESGVDVIELVDLGFGAAKLVVAVPEKLGVDDPKQLWDGVRVATKFVNTAKRFFNEIGVTARIIKISGSAEVMPSLGAADAIVDLMSTGTTLRAHGLKPIAVILETTARLIASKEALSGPAAEKINEVALLVKGALRAKRRKLVLMNVPDEKLHDVVSILPAMAGPTISRVESKPPMWEVITVVTEDELPTVIARAKEKGARDILVLSIEKVIP